MKALSIRQPYANEILIGQKKIELRTWSTSWRGDLLICSSAKPDANTNGGMYPLGAAICIVKLVDVRPMKRKDCKALDTDILWLDGLCWILADVRPVQPVGIKGKLRLFEVDDRIIRRI